METVVICKSIILILVIYFGRNRVYVRLQPHFVVLFFFSSQKEHPTNSKTAQFSTFPLLHDTYTAPTSVTLALYINMGWRQDFIFPLTNVAILIAAVNKGLTSLSLISFFTAYMKNVTDFNSLVHSCVLLTHLNIIYT